VNKRYRKIVFWPNLSVGINPQVLEIREHVCGLKIWPALIVNQKPAFAIAF